GRRGKAEHLPAVDAAAEKLGLRPGLALAEARARYPDLAVVAEHPGGDRGLLDGIADWCQRYTPLVAADPPDGILLDIAGCAHLYGGPHQPPAQLPSRLARVGCAPRRGWRRSRGRVRAGCNPRPPPAPSVPRSIRCRSPRCVCPATWSRRSSASASSASATWPTCRARR